MKNFIYALVIAILFSAFSAEAQLIQTVVAVTGGIYNANTKEAVSVPIKVTDDTGKTINKVNSNASQNGYYYITGLRPGKTYYFHIIHKDYFKEKFEVKIPNTDKYVEISRDYLVKPLKENIQIQFAVSPFELNKSKLRYGASVILDNITNSLINNPNVKFEILAYPDNNNDKDSNMELTEERAKSLKDYFVIQGVNPERISINGKATTDPNNPMPEEKRAKGKRYIGPTYIVVKSF